ncbi:nickel ABC transporter ATP-binding protein NikE [Pseudomonas sp. LRF_L74]|uniref:nickel ABC transporter ATP-binding protein NikE n=1 Tax=Pseudomonas sp. LRF_L74 TaxID=3369422 RepID=UPI003F609B16
MSKQAVAVLDIRDLTVVYRDRQPPAIADLSLSIAAGESYGLIGESGSGKSTTASAILRNLGEGRVIRGQVNFEGGDLALLAEGQMQALLGNRIAYVPQNALSALNPSMPVGRQIGEVLRRHTDMDTAAIGRRVVQLLEQVELPDPHLLARRYPHQLSGGQQQRALIAMALACTPRLLIMDEPTTGLDADTTVKLIQLIERLRQETHCAILLISHDLGIVSRLCSRVGVLLAGRLVEEGSVSEILQRPQHAYTRRLLDAIPQLLEDARAKPHRPASDRPAMLTIDGLDKTFRQWHMPLRIQHKHALSKVALQVRSGEIVAIVGESGSGKSTLARCIMGMLAPNSGTLKLDGEPLAGLAAHRPAQRQRLLQMVFQNPGSSLNPHHDVRRIIARPLLQAGETDAGRIDERVHLALAQVQLTEQHLARLPHQLSGGEKQRVSLARALICDPELLVCDEPTSALDVSVQASVLETLLALKEQRQMGILFISHDLAVVQKIADQVLVMQDGKVVESGSADQVLTRPRHHYSQSLIKASHLKSFKML